MKTLIKLMFLKNKGGDYKIKELIILNILIIIIILINSSMCLAEEQDNIYLYDSLDIELKIDGEFDMISTSHDYEIKELTANLLLYPQTSYQQELIDLSTDGTIENNYLKFNWENPPLGTKYFSLQSKVKTNYHRNEINKKVQFPIPDLEEYLVSEPELSTYLEETEIIDFSNYKIIEQANELADGEDDLFKVAFILASWVEENIEYDLNDLTTDASQKSSWVLENKQGVCDEMTSLFISMSRSLGIPAKFVTGVSYTNSELFDEPWQAHGWAELYFPKYGLVSFDPTFGEYGYVDVTHIKLKDSVDPSSPSTTYQWIANNVELEKNKLDIDTSIVDYGNQIEEELSLELEILEEEVGFDSFNLVKAIIKNNYDFYSASTLSLAIPEEIEIIGNIKQKVLLEPKELKEIYWIIKIPENLQENFIYDFPYLIYTEKNVTVMDTFKSTKKDITYTYEEIKELIPGEKDNSYSRKILLDCQYTEIIKLGEQTNISCDIQNKGNTGLTNLNLCIEDKCETTDLPINQDFNLKTEFIPKESGWDSIFIKAENEFVKKQKYLNLKILDDATINTDIKISNNISYNENFFTTISLSKESFSIPEDITVILTSNNIQNTWKIEQLNDNEDIIIEFSSKGLTFENHFPLEISWEDELGNIYSHKENILINVQSKSFWDKIVMFFNNLF